jgi:hypothetical protein
MRQDLNLKASFKHFVMVAIALASFSFLLPFSASAQSSSTTTWKIQVDVTGSPTKPAYSLLAPEPKPAKERCTFADPNAISTAENLLVCPDDAINWVVKSNKTHLELFLYHKDAVLYDDEGDTAHGFHASNKDTTEGALVSEYATTDVDHKYYVVVLDKDTPLTYYDDPKIIIGTGSVGDVVRSMEKLCKGVSTRPDAKDLSRRLCKDVQILTNLLHLE